jgi:hypothetical protein
LAVVWAVKHFRPYLYGAKFTIVTDHVALRWLMTTRDFTGKLARWSLLLQEYDFEIKHRPGTQHGNVDGLTRAGWDDAPPPPGAMPPLLAAGADPLPAAVLGATPPHDADGDRWSPVKAVRRDSSGLSPPALVDATPAEVVDSSGSPPPDPSHSLVPPARSAEWEAARMAFWTWWWRGADPSTIPELPLWFIRHYGWAPTNVLTSDAQATYNTLLAADDPIFSYNFLSERDALNGLQRLYSAAASAAPARGGQKSSFYTGAAAARAALGPLHGGPVPGPADPRAADSPAPTIFGECLFTDGGSDAARMHSPLRDLSVPPSRPARGTRSVPALSMGGGAVTRTVSWLDTPDSPDQAGPSGLRPDQAGPSGLRPSPIRSSRRLVRSRDPRRPLKDSTNKRSAATLEDSPPPSPGDTPSEETADPEIDYAQLACEMCEDGGHARGMLLCDSCDKGFHLWCLLGSPA